MKKLGKKKFSSFARKIFSNLFLYHKIVAPEWEYIPEGWNYAQTHPEVKGWNVQEVLNTYKQKWPKFVQMVQGTAPLGISHESSLTTNEDIYSHNLIMAFAYALSLASLKKEELSFLDWGGGIGHFFLLAKSLLPDIEIDYHCKDVPLMVKYGGDLFPTARFFTNNDCFKYTYDFVMASGSIHYSENWQTLLTELASVTSAYMYIANLPTVQKTQSFVFLQRPYRYGYNTEYLAWCINQAEFLSIANQSGLDLVREFIYGQQPIIVNAPEQNSYRGYLFHKSSGKHNDSQN